MVHFLSIFADRFSGADVHLTTDNRSPLSFESVTNVLSPTIQSFKTSILQKDEMPASVN
jgi:hypothetical protein